MAKYYPKVFFILKNRRNMKVKTIFNTVFIFTIAIGLTAGFAFAIGEIWQLVSVTAEVQKVDLEKRELTIKGPQGNVSSFTVDKRVKRLNEIKVGDKIQVDYFRSVAGELRQPTAEEKNQPLTVLEGAAKAPPDTAPAAGGLRQIRAVVNIVDIDRAAETVTLTGPLGNTLTVRVADPGKLEKVKKGDTVIVTYTEALAVSVEKAN